MNITKDPKASHMLTIDNDGLNCGISLITKPQHCKNP